PVDGFTWCFVQSGGVSPGTRGAMKTHSHTWLGPFSGVLLALLAAPGFGQELVFPAPAPSPVALPGRPLDLNLLGCLPEGDHPLPGSRPRIHLFRMPTGFLSDPVGIEPEVDPPRRISGRGRQPPARTWSICRCK